VPSLEYDNEIYRPKASVVSSTEIRCELEFLIDLTRKNINEKCRLEQKYKPLFEFIMGQVLTKYYWPALFDDFEEYKSSLSLDDIKFVYNYCKVVFRKELKEIKKSVGFQLEYDVYGFESIDTVVLDNFQSTFSHSR